VKCLIEGGYEIVEAPLPVLMTVVGSANVPRPKGAKRLMRFKRAVTRSEHLAKHGGRDYEDANLLADEEEQLKKKELWIHEWSATDIGADPERIGMPGSPTKVKKIESVVLTGSEYQDVPPTDKGINALVHELIEDHILS
jgi:electron transfer flavoprotein beta subunit